MLKKLSATFSRGLAADAAAKQPQAPGPLRAQAATEYLVLFAAVLIVALAAISYIASNYSSGEHITELESQVYWRNIAKPFQIHAASAAYGRICEQDSQGGFQIYIKNAEPYDIYIKNISIGGASRVFCVAGAAPGGPIMVPALGKRLLAAITSSGETPCTDGEVAYLEVDFTYNKTGIPEMSQNGGKPLVLQCANSQPVSESSLEPAGTSALEPVTISTSSLPAGQAGTSYSSSVSATGGTPPYAWAASGLPSGISIAISTGALSGTPLSEGEYSPTFIATDSIGVPGSKSLAISISAAPPDPIVILTESLPEGTEGKDYSALLEAKGGSGIYIWAADGLPEKLECVDNAILGSLKSKTAGEYEIAITATDKESGEAAKTSLILIVNEK